MVATATAMSARGCPGVLSCPLYILSHDARSARYGCVHDLLLPCRGKDPVEFERLLNEATKAALAPLLQYCTLKGVVLG